MNYLLDTQAVIWTLQNHPNLPSTVKETVNDPDHAIYITVVSLWEIAIKRSIGKLELKYALETIEQKFASEQTDMLPIRVKHLNMLEQLIRLDQHKDPFDRLIISQAKAEEYTIITNDPHFAQYEVDTLWKE